MKRILALWAPIFVLTACVAADPNTQQVSARSIATSNAHRNLVESHIREATREPEATRFRRIQSYALSNGDTALCGEVNAKNAYGGYVGYTPFYVRLRDGRLHIANWDERFSYIAERACLDAAAGSLMIAPG